jgi:serine/threonine protein kinase
MPLLPVSIGEVFEGKYRVERVIGEGGMGVVVMAHHLELDHPVAIKFLLDGLSESADGAERFRREARAAAKIQSDHVARVYDVGVLASGERYMVMEYLKGRDLGEELSARGRLPVAYGARLMLEVLEAVGEAHGAGIVHRDLKPSNVFLAERADGRIRVKVLDFGISKAVGLSSASDLSLTKTSAWMGSPLYMAPEQMQSARTVDARADIWSFGAIFYEVLTGEPPYVAESLPQLCTLLLSQDARPVREKRAEVPKELDELVLKCLRRDPAHRYETTTELTADLQLCLAQLSASGRESSPGSVSLAPIASRLSPTDSRQDAIPPGTLIGQPIVSRASPVPGSAKSTGPSSLTPMAADLSRSLVNPVGDTALHPPTTNGSWATATQKSGKGENEKPAKSGAAMALGAALVLGLVGSIAWFALAPSASPTEPMSPTNAPLSPASVVTAPEPPSTEATRPTGATEASPAAPENAAVAPSAPDSEDETRPRTSHRPRRIQPIGQAPSTNPIPAPSAPEPAPQVSTPTAPPETKPSRPEPTSKDEFGRFGGRR